MSKKKTKSEIAKQEKHIRRLYALIWLLACPLAYVVAKLMGFAQINIVYWTLLLIPVLLGVYNVRQVPPLRARHHAESAPAQTAPLDPDAPVTPPVPPEEDEDDEGVSPVKRAQLLALSLKAPTVIALPLLITVVVDTILRAQG